MTDACELLEPIPPPPTVVKAEPIPTPELPVQLAPPRRTWWAWLCNLLFTILRWSASAILAGDFAEVRWTKQRSSRYRRPSCKKRKGVPVRYVTKEVTTTQRIIIITIVRPWAWVSCPPPFGERHWSPPAQGEGGHLYSTSPPQICTCKHVRGGVWQSAPNRGRHMGRPLAPAFSLFGLCCVDFAWCPSEFSV